jgi:glutamate racemase
MIWVFDSWLWGRHTLLYLQKELPNHNFLYLWDTKNLPYGTKDPQFLKERTFECLEWMFAQWCTIVILACNTASAYAIRPWQEQFPDRKVLSVTVPGIEKILHEWFKKPVLFATQATIQSAIYSKVLDRLCPQNTLSFVSLIWTGVVDRIERSIWTFELIQNLFGTIRNEDYDSVVLGCTHYSLITHEIQEIVWKRIPIVDPGLESAVQLKNYLARHSQIQITTGWIVKYYATWNADDQLVHVDL